MSKVELRELQSVAEIIMGQSPESDSYNDKGEGIPFYQGNADFGEIHPQTRLYCSKPTKIARVDDILLSVRAPIGAINIAHQTCCIGRGLAAIRVNENASTKFLYYGLKRKNNELNQKGTGSTFKAINRQNLSEIKIPHPPLHIQNQIAHELDTVSELQALRNRKLKELDHYIQSVFYGMFGDPVQNEKGWGVKSFEQIGKLTSGGTPSRSNNSYFKGDINWFSAGELNSRYLVESKEKITSSALASSSAKLFEPYSMLIGMYDTAAFKLAILTNPSSSNQACANIAVKRELVNVEWLYDCCRFMKNHFLKNRRGVRQKNLNLGMIKEFELPVPPLSLQNKFAEIVTQIEAQKALVKQSIDETQKLFDSLMSKYFDD